MPRDPHEVLGIAPGASEDEQRAAFRRRARALHPDVDGGDADAMRELNAAWAAVRAGAPAAPHGHGHGDDDDDDDAEDDVPPRLPRRLRLWPILVAGAALLVVLTAYAGSPGAARTQVAPVGSCGLDRDGALSVVACGPGGRRIVAVGGPRVRCPDGSDARPLRDDAEGRTGCLARVAGR